MPMMEMLLFW